MTDLLNKTFFLIKLCYWLYVLEYVHIFCMNTPALLFQKFKNLCCCLSLKSYFGELFHIVWISCNLFVCVWDNIFVWGKKCFFLWSVHTKTIWCICFFFDIYFWICILNMIVQTVCKASIFLRLTWLASNTVFFLSMAVWQIYTSVDNKATGHF